MANKVAFVTGAGMGVGMGIAIELAKAGYDVAIHHSPSASSTENAQKTCRLMESYGVRTLAIGGDLRKMDSIRGMFRKVEEEFGGIDLFVNNAGVTLGNTILDANPNTWDTVFKINVKAALFCLQEAGRNMIRHGIKGNMVVILSNQMRFFGFGSALYPSSKVALEKVVQAAAVELIPFGIRVNGIAPGCVDTGAERMGDSSQHYGIPAQRWVTLEEMGQMVLFLSSPWTQSVVGEVIMLDGGATLSHMGNGLAEYRDDVLERVKKGGSYEDMFGEEGDRRAQMHKKWDSPVGEEKD